MLHRGIRAGTAAFIALLLCTLALPTNAGPRSVSPQVAAARLHRALSRLPAMPLHRFRPTAYTAVTYAIHDVGAPKATAFVNALPAGFNSTGQIFGFGNNPTKGGRQECLLYTGTSFVSLSSSQTVSACYPRSMDDAGSGSTVDVVGTVQTIYESQELGFTATTNLSSGHVTFHDLAAYPASQLIGVNGSGQALGVVFYSPAAGFFTSTPPITFGTVTRQLTLLQSGCISSAQGCLQVQANSLVCPFGGCQISNSGQVLGQDVANAAAEIYTPSSGSAQDLTVPANSLSQMNSNDQLIFAVYSVSPSGAIDAATYLYDIAAGSTTQVPAVPGDPNSCATYLPISLNNSGEILGFTDDCATGASFYFTYDPVNGTQNLSNEFPITSAYDSIQPLGVNDNGQILVVLERPIATTHWGTLVPTSSNGGAARANRPTRRHKSH